MNIKVFGCKFCKDKGIETNFSRSGLRKHLRLEHIRNELFNHTPKDSSGKTESHGHSNKKKQEWILEREV
jgi:hypothetical protein